MTCNPAVSVRYQLPEVRVRVVETMAEQHAHDDVRHTRRDQLFHVERTTLLLSEFVHHLFHFHQDPRLNHSPTETKPFQDGQAQPLVALELGIIMTEYKS